MQPDLKALCSAVRVGQVPPGGSLFDIRSILTSLGQLKFHHPVLLDSIAEFLVERKESVTPRDLTTFLFTAAALNHTSTASEPLFKVGNMEFHIEMG